MDEYEPSSLQTRLDAWPEWFLTCVFIVCIFVVSNASCALSLPPFYSDWLSFQHIPFKWVFIFMCVVRFWSVIVSFVFVRKKKLFFLWLCTSFCLTCLRGCAHTLQNNCARLRRWIQLRTVLFIWIIVLVYSVYSRGKYTHWVVMRRNNRLCHF